MMHQPSMGCSSTWYRTFLDTIPAERTAREVAFLTRQLPRPVYGRVLDLCSGPGRHTLPLAQLGYVMTGVDRDAGATVRAAAAARVAGLQSSAAFVIADMRALPFACAWDAVLNLWASFGYFDAATNERVLAEVAGLLRPGGRLILDVYHRGFFEQEPVDRELERAGARYRERRRLEGDRLHVELAYGDSGEVDRFAWQVWSPDGLSALAAGTGLDTLLACANHDEGTPATPDLPRMQLVFEKRPWSPEQAVRPGVAAR